MYQRDVERLVSEIGPKIIILIHTEHPELFGEWAKKVCILQLEKYFAEAEPTIEYRLRDIVLSHMADFPLSVKFKQYWKSRFGHETSLHHAHYKEWNLFIHNG